MGLLFVNRYLFLAAIICFAASLATSAQGQQAGAAETQARPPAVDGDKKLKKRPVVKSVKVKKPDEIQPGDQVVADAIARQVKTVEQTQAVMREVLDRKYYERMPLKLPGKLDPLAARILFLMVKDNSVSEALTEQISNDPDQAMRYLRSAFILFPIDRYELINDPALAALVDEDRIRLLAVEMGVDPSEAFASPAAGSQEPFIQPLIESASITVFNEPTDAVAQIRYRPKGSTQWQAGHNLYYEPSRGTLTGSIVYLTAATDYQVEVILSLQDKEYKRNTYEFTTWPDKPPIDPNKVYYLKDIYKGGMLDLETLDIQGEEGAWAKIVGDPNTPIVAGNKFTYGLHIGNKQYIYLENITIKQGGRRHGIRSYRAHHIWVNGCDIAQWGRKATIVKDSVGYEFEGADPIDYDAGMYFKESGAIVVENCHVHDPIPKASNWKYGHPKGATAFFAHANHPKVEYKGQIVLRNNVFEGSPDHRFNDVVEGRSNGNILGGFVRDSAIYNNTFRYGNDDGIEIDGGQSNVLVYNNDISNTYVGISVIPNRLGPSYVFNNYIHNLADETGSQWTAIKAGGLVAGPIGQVNIFNNLITVARNGISASDYKDDRTFWLNVVNNIIITKNNNDMVGYGIYDDMKYSGSRYVNNYIYNLRLNRAKNDAEITQEFHDKSLLNTKLAKSIFDTGASTVLNNPDNLQIKNFTQNGDNKEMVIYGINSK